MPTVSVPFVSRLALAGAAGVLFSGVAQASTVDFTCLPDPGPGVIVGTAPLAIYCEVVPPADGSWSEVSWTVGDGTVLYGDTMSYRYLEPGDYTVSVQLDDFQSEDPTAEPKLTRYGYVTICGVPEPAFTFENHGELDIELKNLTPVTVGCTDQLQWELFRGRPVGEPERVWDLWEPRFTLPDEGVYTIRLTVSGIAGTGAAELRFEGRHQLPDELTDGPTAMACSTPSGGGVGWLALGALAAAGLASRPRRSGQSG